MSAEDIDIELQIEEAPISIKQDDNNDEKIKWNNICTRYIWSIAIFNLFFGMQQDGKYHKTALSLGFIHFAAELEVVYYLLFRKKSAQRLSIITYIIYGIQSIMVWPMGELSFKVFGIVFLFSDFGNFIVSLSFIFNDESNKQLKIMCFAFTVHFIGASWGFILTFMSLFIDPNITTGCAWICICFCCMIQMYLLKPIISQEITEIKIPIISIKRKILLICSVFAVLSLFIIARLFRTTTSDESESGLDKKWGDAIEIPLMRICGPILAWCAIYYTCYHYKSSQPKNEKARD